MDILCDDDMRRIGMKVTCTTSITSSLRVLTRNGRRLFDIPHTARVGIFIAHAGSVDAYLAVDVPVVNRSAKPLYGLPITTVLKITCGGARFSVDHSFWRLEKMRHWLDIRRAPYEVPQVEFTRALASISRQTQSLDGVLADGIGSIDVGCW